MKHKEAGFDFVDAFLTLLTACGIGTLLAIAASSCNNNEPDKDWADHCRTKCAVVNGQAVAGFDGKCYCVLR